ncbi:MAG TPA: CotH kinase family protein, partial [Saprospiraceae bacterium]|nr:CotH kinase family protein [Saprospiraceae bacterium]
MSYKAHSKLSLLFALLVLLIISCHKDPKLTDGYFSESNNFTSFKIEKVLNPHLNEEITFTILKDRLEVQGLSRYYPKIVPTFTTSASQRSGLDTLDLREKIVYTLTDEKGVKKTYDIIVNWHPNIAQLKINTSNNTAINSKTVYQDATFTFEGQNFYLDYRGEGQVRGRGNSTWGMPKKPYKIKLKSDASIAGLKAEKDWVLLANYLDGAHILNAIAFKIGHQLAMPYTNNIIPVELSINGIYNGLYMLTEQVEVKKNRVNIGKDGIFLELDSYFDEDWKFRSTVFNLPVNIINPEITSQDQVNPIKEQFNQLESLLTSAQFPNNNYTDIFDIDAYVNFLIVCMLTDNQELNHPKSTFMHKLPNGKFTMGPLWDFDWAFGYEGTQVHFANFNRPIFWSNNALGTRFFSQIIKDPQVKTLLKQKWTAYKSNHLNELLKYIDQYSFLITGARQKDYNMWK